MGFIRQLTGSDTAKAAERSGEIQAEFGREASALLDPFQQLGQSGLDQAGFLTDPQAQFDFLQNNPLFDLSLQNLNQQTKGIAASQGRLSAGDTLQQLSNNTLLAAQPLIGQQQQQVGNLLNIGQNVAANQGNLLTGQGASLAGGIVGGANAKSQAANNLLNLGLQGAGTLGSIFLSDPRLKSNVKKIGLRNGFNWYEWKWNHLAKKEFGLTGVESGVMANEIKNLRPDAVGEFGGFMTVDYHKLGLR